MSDGSNVRSMMLARLKRAAAEHPPDHGGPEGILPMTSAAWDSVGDILAHDYEARAAALGIAFRRFRPPHRPAPRGTWRDG